MACFIQFWLRPKTVLRSTFSRLELGARSTAPFSASCKAGATAGLSPCSSQYVPMPQLSQPRPGVGAGLQSSCSSTSHKKTQIIIKLQRSLKPLSSSLLSASSSADPASIGNRARHLLSSKSKLNPNTPPSSLPPPSNAAAPQSPPIRPKQKHQNKQHHDLRSYLAHLKTKGANPTSDVAKGTLYEYTALAALSRLGFQRLVRSGCSHDNGVDLHGLFAVAAAENGPTETAAQVATTIKPSWSKEKRIGQNRGLTTSASQGRLGFKVIVQCKATKRNLSSKLVREMAGVHARSVHDDLSVASQQQQSHPTVLFLVSNSGLT